MSKKIKKTETSAAEDEKFPLPIYEPKEDIYSNEEKESLEDDEEVPGDKKAKKKSKKDSLDVPGSELDDQDEAIGEEDEENNYYSLGGDDHENLDEDQA